MDPQDYIGTAGLSPRAGELFCYFNFSLILNSSLSPVRGSYSYDAIEVGKVLQFVPRAGELFWEIFPRIFKKKKFVPVILRGV